MIFANEFTHYINGHPSIKTDIVRLKNYLSNSEYTYVNELLKDTDKKKKIFKLPQM